ncbi:PQ-loop-domain-containing protein [Cladochytrium replicatum]|nr:PQ-loop-domain-containing protein [Cladochytrium replicatum]
MSNSFPVLLGWFYTTAWSLSFYGQLSLNWRRKSVTGLSFDFLALNTLGFTFYTIYNIAFFTSPVLRDQYRKLVGTEISVEWNDVVFAAHAITITLITVAQCFVYPRSQTQRVSAPARAFVGFALWGIVVLLAESALAGTPMVCSLVYLSLVKLATSLVKYIPQVYLNAVRRSTEGWSIVNILLDFVGGLCSMLQLLIDTNWDVLGNPVKFGLGFISVAFDLIFIFQHYILYPRRPHDEIVDPEQERRRLIAQD